MRRGTPELEVQRKPLLNIAVIPNSAFGVRTLSATHLETLMADQRNLESQDFPLDDLAAAGG